MAKSPEKRAILRNGQESVLTGVATLNLPVCAVVFLLRRLGFDLSRATFRLYLVCVSAHNSNRVNDQKNVTPFNLIGVSRFMALSTYPRSGEIPLFKIIATLQFRLAAAFLFTVFGWASFGVQAGNLWLTGHDADLHCTGGQQCNHFGVALNFSRQSAPDKTKPMLFLDSGTQLATAAGQGAAKAKNTVEGAGNAFSFTVVGPSTPAFATLPLTTANYSAIVVASDSTCGGCDNSATDITAINARTADIQAFFNAGGGLVYFAGADRRATYYSSVPIPAGAVAVAAPFTLTAAGTAIGLIAPADTNCCPTHNSFNLPPFGSSLVVLETDSAGRAETLSATATTTGGLIGAPPPVVQVPTISGFGLAALMVLLPGLYLFGTRRRVGSKVPPLA